MNVIMHLLFSGSVRKIVKETQGIKLNRLGFMIGNILPDISKYYNDYPHYYTKSFPFLQDRKDQLMQRHPLDTRFSNYCFARDLGVINHYLADYFCHAHSEKYNGNIAVHSLYELFMIVGYRRGLRMARELVQESKRPLTPQEFHLWVPNLIANYEKQKPGFSNDICHALYAGVLISVCAIVHAEYYSFNPVVA